MVFQLKREKKDVLCFMDNQKRIFAILDTKKNNLQLANYADSNVKSSIEGLLKMGGQIKMSEQIKFDSKYYPEVKRYLENQEILRGGTSFGDGGRIYLTGYKTTKGFILQNCCEKSNQSMVSVINDHPSFNKIKSDLQKIIEEKNE